MVEGLRQGTRPGDLYSGTGRTSRMLHYALHQMHSGRRVVVIFDTQVQAKLYFNWCLEQIKGTGMSCHQTEAGRIIRCTTGRGILQIVRYDPERHRIEQDRILGEPIDTLILVDHSVIQARIPNIARHLTQF